MSEPKCFGEFDNHAAICFKCPVNSSCALIVRTNTIKFDEGDSANSLEEITAKIYQHAANNYATEPKKSPPLTLNSISDGSTADYYQLPPGATQLQDLIAFTNMNAQIGEIFRACYRYGRVAHSPCLRDAKKIKFYIEAEIARLEKYENQ